VIRPNRQVFRHLISLPVVALGVVASAHTVAVPHVAAGEPCEYCAGGEYHPLEPVRLLDTRNPSLDVSPLGAKPAGAGGPSFDLPLLAGPLADDGITSGDVLAVMVTITVDSPSQAGYLSAVPKGAAPADTSIINFSQGQAVANLALVRPGVDGDLTVSLTTQSAGSANVIVDLQGWFSTSDYTAGTPGDLDDERGARLIPVSPGRIVDTRLDGSGGALGPGEVRMLQIRGADTVSTPVVTDIVPATGDPREITGVLLNLTGIQPTSATFLSVLPSDPGGFPATSNVNLAAMDVKANLVAVPLGVDGEVYLFNERGNTNVAIDVVGYFERVTDETRAGRVVPLSAPFRSLDTRQQSFGAVPLGPGQSEEWSFAQFAASVNIGGESLGEQLGVLGNLTNASLYRQYPTVPVGSFLTVYPSDGSALPTVSNLNMTENVSVPNMALLMYGNDQQLKVFNAFGYSHYIFDASAVILADSPTP